MPKAQETVLEIDLKALKHNFEHLKSKLKNNTKFLAVVKAFGYGSDACEIAKYLQDLDTDYFAVANRGEGTVTIYNADTQELETNIILDDENAAPTYVVYSTKRDKLYVADFNNAKINIYN